MNRSEYSINEIVDMLSASSPEDVESLRKKAYSTMVENVGENVYLRGLVEFSNICASDCLYCGIRRSNRTITRYTLDKQEILEATQWAAEKGFGSVVLQSGERSDARFVDFVTHVVSSIKKQSISEKLPSGLGITLCVGEQTEETYRQFFEAGAHRYLLRIETSNHELFEKIHPKDQSFDKRLECLNVLNKVGYQVGTGVMIGIPGQTLEDLAKEILFFKKMDVDMIGMGPFIVHHQTPFAYLETEYAARKEEIYNLALKMIAATRIVLKDVNIASTTALQAMNPVGREEGLMYGANVIMPNLTPTKYRRDYQLYEGKPCLEEVAGECFSCIQMRIASTGRTAGIDSWGDSKHFGKKSAIEN
jgi:biotin synthase